MQGQAGVIVAITIRHAEAADPTAIAELTAEMDRFYGIAGQEPHGDRIAQIHDAIFGDQPAAYALLAWDGERLAGYSFLCPAVRLTRSLYLKEPYVSQSARGACIGTLLMRGLFEIAAKRGCSRVEWTTDEDNTGAQAFYEKLGAQPDSSKWFYRVQGNDLLAGVGIGLDR